VRGAAPRDVWAGPPRRSPVGGRLAVAALAVVLALGGCGSDDERARLDPDSAGRLHALLGEVRGAAEAGDRSRALAAIDRFGATVRRLGDRGELGAADLRALRLGAQRVERRIQLVVAATEPPPSLATPEPSAQPDANEPQPKKAKPEKAKGPKKPGKGHTRKEKR
jgi:hypothetical protein